MTMPTSGAWAGVGVGVGGVREAGDFMRGLGERNPKGLEDARAPGGRW
jgi:hypothetical protein